VNRQKLEAMLVLHEGRRARVYRDSLGKLTVGVGCYLDRGGVPALFAALGIDFVDVHSGRVALTDAQIDAVFEHDADAAIHQARLCVPELDELPEPAQLALVDMAFQLGQGGLAGFRQTIAAIRQRRWDDAAGHMLDSLWAEQTPQRARANAALIRLCAQAEAEDLRAALDAAMAAQVDGIAPPEPTSRHRGDA